VTLPSPDEPADLVLTGGRIWTGDAARSSAEAVAVRDGRITAVGPAGAVRQTVGPRTRVIDLHGRMVTPGFGDAHAHPVMSALTQFRCNLLEDRGQEGYLGIVARYVAEHPEREWVEGEGWYMPDFPGGTPRREDLDRVTAGKPAFLYNRDGHGAWVNTAALERAGITAATPDPPDGRIERDPDGTPSGTLHEGACHLVERLLPPATHEEWLAALRWAIRHFHSLGITNWQDAHVAPEYQAAYHALAATGELTPRVVGALWWDRHRGVDQVPELVERRRTGFAGRYAPTAVKIMQDGVFENFTAAMVDPYLGSDGRPTRNRGLSLVDPSVLNEAVAALDVEGFQVHFHAIGDRAIREALDAFEVARSRNGRSDHRHHIAHIQVIHPDDIPRFASLDVVANAQALWAVQEAQMDDLTIPFLGPARVGWQYPFRSLRRAGAVLAMGSDWSVSTADPLAQIHTAVNRVFPGTDAEPFLPEERLDLPDALAAFTAGSAYVNHLDEAGVLAPGRLADIAVLDRDLFDRGAGAIADASVIATIVEGQVVHETAALEG
jgi:predicted amidohydrolase YtcJ